MVRVIDYLQRVKDDGDSFFVLVLQGGVQMVKSKQTNKFYVTAKKATISSTFDENTCQALIGTELPGKIEKVQTEPYEFTIKETGEVVELDYRYEYQEDEPAAEKVPEPEKIDRTESTVETILEMSKQREFSMNGVE